MSDEHATTRREFLEITGATLLGAGAALSAGRTFAQAQPADAKPVEKDVKVRLAVVGGGFGAGHHWHEHPHCQVTAVTDLVEDRRQNLVRAYNCPNAFPSLEVMLEEAADQFDAVAVFTDGPSHARHAILCMEKGKHVTSACPAAMNLEDLHALKEIKERTGLTYMMHESSYYRQPCIAARELYEAGELGRLVLSEVEYHHPGIGAKSDSLSRWQGLKSWRYGLPPLLYATHSLGLLVGVTRERILKVSCMGERVGADFPTAEENQYGNPFDNEFAIGYTSGGNVCRFSVFWQIASHGERGQWFGDKKSCFMASYGGQRQAIAEVHGGWKDWDVPRYWETDRLPEPMRHDSGHGGSAAFLSAEFIDALVEGREPTCDLYESIAMTAPGIVAHESALKGGELLEVPQFDRA